MGEPSLDDANVKVAVRVRPMNRRGKEELSGCLHFPSCPCCSTCTICTWIMHFFFFFFFLFFAQDRVLKLLCRPGRSFYISHSQHPRVAAPD